MFKKFKSKANIIILLYDAVSDTLRLISECSLICAFLFYVGFFYDLSINPIFEADYVMCDLYVAVAFFTAVIFWFVHKIMCWLRLKFVDKITSIFPVHMMIGERVKR